MYVSNVFALNKIFLALFTMSSAVDGPHSHIIIYDLLEFMLNYTVVLFVLTLPQLTNHIDVELVLLSEMDNGHTNQRFP
jgi:hypothetical protein